MEEQQSPVVRPEAAVTSPFSEEQLRVLQTPPAKEEYRLRGDKQPYLPIEYYRRVADDVFGAGQWAVLHDLTTLRWETLTHPFTQKVVGVLCNISTTVTVRGCMPITVVGHAPVQFRLNNGAIVEQQSIGVFELAQRAAEAKGFKKALGYFGPVFVCATGSETAHATSTTTATRPSGVVAPTQPPLQQPQPSPSAPKLRVVQPEPAGVGSQPKEAPRLITPTTAAGVPTNKRSKNPTNAAVTSPASAAVVTASQQQGNPTEEAVAVVTTTPPDPWGKGSRSPANSAASANNNDQPEPSVQAMITAQQVRQIEDAVGAKGYSIKAADATASKLYGVTKITELTMAQAADLIGQLSRLKPKSGGDSAVAKAA